MYTFGSASFSVLITKPDGSYDTDVTEVHIPGGNVNYTDIGGRLPSHIDLSLYFSSASAFTAMSNAVSSASTLTVPSGSYAGVVLKSLQRTWLSNNTQLSFADASFITQ